jgi:drug/metabolite transporter (DMT)-like permease
MNYYRTAIAKLVAATALFALGPVVLKLLVMMGGRFGLKHPDAISFCNVLFVGNLCAAIVTLIVFGSRSVFLEMLRLPRRAVASLLLASTVATIYPAMIFIALEYTSIFNVVLVSRFNGVALAVFGWLSGKSDLRRPEAAGYAVMAVSVLGLLLVNNHGFYINTGEALVLTASIFYVLIEVLNQKATAHCTVHTYVFFRNAVSAGIFFGVASYLFGFNHFADAFTGDLWILMVIYAAFAVVAAQWLWLKATAVLSVGIVANMQLVNPAFSLAFALILLHERPRAIDGLVVALLLIGVMIPRLARRYSTSRTALVAAPTAASLIS